MPANDAKFVRGVLILFAAVGLILLVCAGVAYRSKCAYLAKAVTVPGEVVGLKKDRKVYYPVFAYVTQDEKRIEFTGSIGSSPPAYDVGEPVEVVYDPNFPEDAEVSGFFSRWLTVIILGCLGIGFSMPFVVWLVHARRARPQRT